MTEQPIKPDCYECVHRRAIPGDAHSECANTAARVTGRPHGIQKGWFNWPFNFDSIWLVSCDGFGALAPLPPGSSCRVFLDGDKWCAVLPDFIDLQSSPAGFGETQKDALGALRAAIGAGWSRP